MSISTALRRAVSLAAIALLAGNALFSKTDNQQQVKEQALLIPEGAPVEVRLLNRQTLRGRMGVVSDQGFAMRGVFEGKIEERTIAFREVKSIRYYNQFGSRLRVSYILAAVSMAASLAIAATR